MLKLSIIIPVYNSDKYIYKCLESLKKQKINRNDFEIIIVNDGSVDNSENVIKKYIETNKDLNIRYYKKENGGLSSARNYGVKYAKGEYISFIDSDDFLEETLFENLMKYMNEETDVIKFKMKMVDEVGNQIERLDGPVFEKCSGEEAYIKLATKDKFIDPACIYLYRKEFFVNNKFEYKLKYHEDFGLTSLIIVNAKSFVSTDIYGYNYVQSEESLTRSSDYSKNILRAEDMMKHYDNMLIDIPKYKLENKTKELLKRYYTNSIILKADTLQGNDRKRFIKEIKKRKMYKNIKPENIKQLIKRNLLRISINLYLKVR